MTETIRKQDCNYNYKIKITLEQSEKLCNNNATIKCDICQKMFCIYHIGFIICSMCISTELSKRTINNTAVDESSTCVDGGEAPLVRPKIGESTTHIEADYLIDVVIAVKNTKDEGILHSETDVDEVEGSVTHTTSSITEIKNSISNGEDKRTIGEQEVAYTITEGRSEVPANDSDGDDLYPCECSSCYYCGVI